MYKTLGAILLAGLSSAAWAEHRGVFPGGFRTFGSPSGFGNILFPGTGSAPPIPNPFHHRPTTFAQRLGATVGGFPGRIIGGGHGRLGHRGIGAGIVAYPVAVPVYMGGYAAQPQPPSVVYVQQPMVPPVPPAPPSPPVVINQYFTPDTARPVVRDYSQEALPETRPSGMQSYQAPIAPHPKIVETGSSFSLKDVETIYLIAYRDQTIYPARAFWVEGGTLHYITVQGSHNRASLELIDREMTERLNKERNVRISLDPK